MGEIRILPDGHFAEEKVAQGVRAEIAHVVERLDHVSGALRNLQSRAHPKAVHQHVLRKWDIARFQHDQPVDRVRRHHNILADHMVVHRPPPLKIGASVSNSRNVVDKGIKPHIGHTVRVKRKRDTPFQPGARARNTQIAEGILQKLEHLLLPIGWHDEVRIVLQESDQPLLILRQLEKVVGLADLHHLSKNLGPLAIDLILVLQKLLGPLTVEAGVLALVDFPFVEQTLQQQLNHSLVPGLCCADVVVVGDIEALTQLLIDPGHAVTQRLRSDSLPGSRLLHLLAMLVQSGQKMNRITPHPPIPGNGIGQHLFVGVTNMRLPVCIIDRSGDVEILHEKTS